MDTFYKTTEEAEKRVTDLMNLIVIDKSKSILGDKDVISNILRKLVFWELPTKSILILWKLIKEGNKINITRYKSNCSKSGYVWDVELNDYTSPVYDSLPAIQVLENNIIDTIKFDEVSKPPPETPYKKVFGTINNTDHSGESKQ